MSTIAVQRIDAAGAPSAGTRERGAILGKDQPRKRQEALRILRDGRVVVGFQGGRIGDPCGIQIRAGDSLAVTDELAEVRPPFALHRALGRIVAGGPRWGGYQASAHLLTLDPLTITRTLPVRYPFAWMPDGETFLAQSPHFFDGLDADPALIARESWLEPVIGESKKSLVRVDAERNRCITIRKFDAPGEAFALALALDGSVAWWASHYNVIAAEDVASSRTLWQRKLGAPGSMFFAQTMAASDDGERVAVAGSRYTGALPDLFIVDGKTGASIVEIRILSRISYGGARIDALAWLDDAHVIAGTAGGALAIAGIDGSLEIWRGAQAGIRSIAVDRERSRILVCGAEKHLRSWPL